MTAARSTAIASRCLTAWRRWRELTNGDVQAEGSEHFEHFYLSLQAASAGMGVAIGSAYMVEEDLRDGRLVARREMAKSRHDMEMPPETAALPGRHR